jgi:hypothetical protein
MSSVVSKHARARIDTALVCSVYHADLFTSVHNISHMLTIVPSDHRTRGSNGRKEDVLIPSQKGKPRDARVFANGLAAFESEQPLGRVSLH